MRFFPKRWIALPVIVAALIMGCDPATPGSLQSPTEPAELLGSLLGGNRVQGYTLVRAPLLPAPSELLSISGVLGAGGGQLSLLGHTLTVPVGAVTRPTLFVLTVLPTGYVEVDLGASVTQLLGGLLDVGGKGFLKTVPVSLSYARATNVSDPSRLTVLRVNSLIGYGKFEVMPSRVDRDARTVTTELDHFSRYVIAMPY